VEIVFSDRLKKLRNKINMRQEDIAIKLGIARTTYAMYEQGKREPDNDTLQKIADLFEVSVDFLLGRTDDPSVQYPSIAFFGGKVTEEEEEYLKESLELFRKMKEKRKQRD
jgi:transcriptional regulator with XRE-family HTH domain